MRKTTDLENRVHQMLWLLGIPHEEQVRIGPYTADFLVREQNWVIEADGGPWHNTPEAQERDKKRDDYLKSLGFTVQRCTERDLRSDPIGLMQEMAVYRSTLRRNQPCRVPVKPPKPASYSKLLSNPGRKGRKRP